LEQGCEAASASHWAATRRHIGAARAVLVPTAVTREQEVAAARTAGVPVVPDLLSAVGLLLGDDQSGERA